MRNVCRSSRAVNSSRASGLIRPRAARRRSPARSRFSWCLAHVGLRLGRFVGPVGGRLGHRLVRPELLHQRRGVDPELLDRPGLQLLDAQALLRARHLVAVDGVGQLAQLLLEGGHVAAEHGQLGVTGGARLVGAAAQGVGLVGRTGEQAGGILGADVDRLGDLRLAEPALPPGFVPGPRIDLRCGRGLSAVARSCRARARSSRVRRASRSSVSCARAPRGGGIEPVALVGRRVGLDGVGLDRRSLVAFRQLRVVRAVVRERRLRGGDGLLGALGLRASAAHGNAEGAELLGDRRHLGVRVVQPVEGLLDRVSGLGHLRAQRGNGEPGPLAAARGLVGSDAGVVHRGLDLDEAGRGRTAPARPPGAVDVPVAGHRRDPVPHQRSHVVNGLHEGDPVEQPVDGRAATGPDT